MSRNRIRRGRVALSLALIALGCLPALAQAAPAPETFEYTGGAQYYRVPAGVTKLSVIALGGAGGAGEKTFMPGVGGASGAAYGTFEVTPGEELTVIVGAAGSDVGSAPAAWGFGCGGLGGTSDVDNRGGGGGAASAVLSGVFPVEGECPEPLGGDPEAVEKRALVVAGGGGGGGEGTAWAKELNPGGAGGDGGNPAGPGLIGGRNPLAGPCGGCAAGAAGESGEHGFDHDGGGGGGGGGLRGGEGGATGVGGGAGGGGGSSFVSGSALDSRYLSGNGSGNGMVVITPYESELFGCSEKPETATVPAAAGLLEIEASGAAGGEEPELGETGGAGARVTGSFEVEPGQALSVSVGCQPSGRDGGWGYGIGGRGGAPSNNAEAGFGGGGSTAVVGGESVLALAGGGGGAGGQGGRPLESRVGHGGGGGGAGGAPPAPGAPSPEGGRGGAGGAIAGHEGGGGEEGGNLSFGGGGGGGGSGWYSGAGGGAGHFFLNQEGGGGGGGGLSHVAPSALKYSLGDLGSAGDGRVTLSYLPGIPAAAVAYGGSKQAAVIGGGFAHPLEARVVDAAGDPVEGAEVAFTLPTSGAGGSFEGGGTTATATTGAEGVAASPPVVADYVGGSWEASAAVAGVSTPATYALVNEASSTAIRVVPSDESIDATESVSFTATVTAAVASAPVPDGFVQFFEAGTALGAPIELSDGSATSETLSGLSVGVHEIEARYEGTPTYQQSVGAARVDVRKAPVATSLRASANPAALDEAVTFTATMSGPTGSGIPYDGLVQFKVDGGPLGAPVQAVGGVATSAAWEAAVAGEHTIIAEPATTSIFEASFGEMRENVDQEGVAIEMSGSANPVEYGLPLRIEMNLRPRPPLTETPRGEIAMISPPESATPEFGCVEQLNEGKAVCGLPEPFVPGSHLIEGQWGGDDNYHAGTGTMVEQVTKARTAPAVTPSRPSAVYGEEVSFGAEVDRRTTGAGTPSGTVEFALDGTAIGGLVSLGDARAQSAPAVPAAGIHLATVTYGGDSDFEGSQATVPYLVEPAATSVALAASAESSQPGAGVSFTATVSPQHLADGDPAPTPTGRVRFRIDGIDFGAPVPLRAGQATSEADTAMAPGTHDIVALYEPDGDDFVPSDARLAHTVMQPTSTVLVSTADPSAAGAPVTVRAHVGPTAAAGSVAFTVDGGAVEGCAAQPLVESEATCTLGGLAAGTHEVGAVYSGSAVLDSSRATITQSVEAAPTTPPGGDQGGGNGSGAGGATSTPAPGPAGPGQAPACGARNVRVQVSVLDGRDAVSFRARNLSAAPARLTVQFFVRGPGGKVGRELGAVRHAFARRGSARLERRLPAALMTRLRAARGGFVAKVRVAAAPGFCAERFNRALSARRNSRGQSVWSEAARRE